MKPIQLATLLGTGLVACSLNAVGAITSDDLYLNADLGASFIQNVTLHSGGEKATAEFYPGARGDFMLGYNVCPEAAIELESGAIWNRFHEINGSSLTGGHLDLFQVPILANAIYHFAWNDKWTSVFGVGAGASVDTLDVVPDNSSAQSATDVAFSYQAQAGIKYALAANMDLGFNYKFLGSLDRKWTVNGNTLRTDDLFTHALLVTFNWKF